MEEQYYTRYYELERNHWWFKARLEILSNFIKRNALRNNFSGPLKILNAGIATGRTTEMLEEFGDVTSLEFDKKCCDFVRNRLKIEVVEGSLTELPFEDEEFDFVCAFDVIEHIENDAKAIQEINRVLKSDGQYFFTVPAYQFLWSEHDEINHHYRRYTIRKFNKLLTNNGLHVNYGSYFNFWLFPPIAISRLLQRMIAKKSDNLKSDFDSYKGQNLLSSILFYIFRSEKAFITRSIKLPFGVSLLNFGTKR